jgi:hypothetical protein
MTSREYLQNREEIENRIAGYERENGRLAAQIVINTQQIAALRRAREAAPAGQPMSEEALRALASAANAQQQSVESVMRPQQTPEGARAALGLGKS